MKNIEKYDHIFKRMFPGFHMEDIRTLRYHAIPEWDSITHMDLMADLEEAFHVHIDTVDVLSFTSYEKGKELLESYGTDFQE